jgi:hypothetical protein
MILYLKVSLSLARLLEDTNEFRTAVQGLRASISKTVQYREEKMRRSVDYQENALTGMCVSVDNRRIMEAEDKIMDNFRDWKDQVLRKEREREKRDKNLTPLDPDEADEEAYEIYKIENEM